MNSPQETYSSCYVTEEVSQSPMGWLKAEALRNIIFILVTLLTSQLLHVLIETRTPPLERLSHIRHCGEAFQSLI